MACLQVGNGRSKVANTCAKHCRGLHVENVVAGDPPRHHAQVKPAAVFNTTTHTRTRVHTTVQASKTVYTGQCACLGHGVLHMPRGRGGL